MNPVMSTSSPNTAAAKVRRLAENMIDGYARMVRTAAEQMIDGIERTSPFPPNANHEWVATYEVGQEIAGPEGGPFTEKIKINTTWRQVHVGEKDSPRYVQ